MLIRYGGNKKIYVHGSTQTLTAKYIGELTEEPLFSLIWNIKLDGEDMSIDELSDYFTISIGETKVNENDSYGRTFKIKSINKDMINHKLKISKCKTQHLNYCN